MDAAAPDNAWQRMHHQVSEALQSPGVPIPANLQQDFLQFQYDNNLGQLRRLNIVTFTAFLLFFIPDGLIVPDMLVPSLLGRCILFVTLLPLALLLMRRLRDIRRIELLLPALALLASIFWHQILDHSESIYAPQYFFAGVVFVIVPSLGMRTDFSAGVWFSGLLSALLVYFAFDLNHHDAMWTLIYLSVYLPVLAFTLFFVWHNCQDDRRMFLLTLLEKTDAAELQEANAKLWLQSHTDTLTGLSNRSLLEDRVQQGVALARRSRTKMAVIYLDLDHFKPVNDSHGHVAGDQLLQEVAQRMKGCVRDSDTVARIGGDEFVLVLSTVQDLADAIAVAQKVRLALSEPFVVLSETTVEVGCSLGVAMFPDHAANSESLIDQADAAMYRAKQSGRNRVEAARQ